MNGKTHIYERAKTHLETIIKQHPGSPLSEEKAKALDDVVSAIAKDAGVEIPLAKP
ncbi:MAG: hypothetical protein XD63_0605 [Thermoanaerobacterales bacterium 50_218]|nr:MAG: hypothetical protein XD63_0605 [Thermoanaerobacterales bacterium 50_218]